MKWIVLLYVVVSQWVPVTVTAQPAASVTAEDPTAALSESEHKAHGLLMDMAAFLAGLESFSANLLAGYDVVQESGQKIQFLESRNILLARPNHLRIDEKYAEDQGHLVVFDGSKVSILDGEAGVFAQTDQPGTVDDTLVYFVRDLKMRLPLAALLTTRIAAEFDRRVKQVDYVEMTDVLGEPTHHIAARTNVLDFQVWIAAGEHPLPLRVVLTYADAGRPQYWAQLTDWDLAPEFEEADFVFTAPPDAEQIVFSVQIPPIIPTPPAENGAAKGAQP